IRRRTRRVVGGNRPTAPEGSDPPAGSEQLRYRDFVAQSVSRPRHCVNRLISRARNAGRRLHLSTQHPYTRVFPLVFESATLPLWITARSKFAAPANITCATSTSICLVTNLSSSPA